MSTCDRFEREGLLALERSGRLGEDLEGHLAACSECTSARTSFETLGARIASAAADIEPPGDWQARVRMEIDRRQTARSWRKPWLLVPAGLAAAALALVFVLPQWLSPNNASGELGRLTPPSLTTRMVSAGGDFRGAEFKPGDHIELTGSVGQAAASELRLYLNDSEVALACSTEPPCQRNGEILSAKTILDLRGRYQAVVLASNEPIPTATGNLDHDLDRALESGALVEMGELLVVR